MTQQAMIPQALELGFSAAAALDPERLVVREDVRAMCQANTCRAYGRNWTCPPYCGTLEECQRRLRGYRQGILLQTVGVTEKRIDTRAYARTEEKHLALLHEFARLVRREHPDALCLGSGGCRLCPQCAWPESCRFPAEAMSSMEGYGLFVTQVCRDHGLAYHHGNRTITYTACILF